VPDSAKIKEKMVYSSSKDALKRSLTGIALEIQGTDFDEVSYATGACSICAPRQLSDSTHPSSREG